MADDGSLAKTLFYDIVRQLRVPAAIASVDSSNCYDHITLAIASLVFQPIGVDKMAVKAMMETIQNVKFFLRTAFGDSKDCVGLTIELKIQRLIQGNTAAPGGCIVIAIIVIRAYKRRGHGANLLHQSAPFDNTWPQFCSLMIRTYYI